MVDTIYFQRKAELTEYFNLHFLWITKLVQNYDKYVCKFLLLKFIRMCMVLV